DDFSIVGGAGAQPYFGHMRAIDVYGLVSDKVAHLTKPSFPRPGHNKLGDHDVLAAYNPDFAFYCYFIPSSPEPPKDRSTFHDCGRWPEDEWEQVTVRIPGLDGRREERDDHREGNGPADRYSFLVRRDRKFECE